MTGHGSNAAVGSHSGDARDLSDARTRTAWRQSVHRRFASRRQEPRNLSSLQAVRVGTTTARRHLPDPVVRVTRQHGWTSNVRRAGQGIAFAVPRSGSFFQRPSTLSLAFRVSLSTRINAGLLTRSCSMTLRLGRRQCDDGCDDHELGRKNANILSCVQTYSMK